MSDSQVRWASGLSLLAGLWLVFSPLWISNSTTANTWQIIFGIVISALALGQMAATRVSWPSWVNLLGGIYFIVAPWVTSASTTVRWNQVVLGIIVAATSIWAISEATEELGEPTRATRRPADAFYERLDGKDRKDR